MERKGEQLVEIGLPDIVHIVPSASEGDRKDLLLEQVVAEGEIKILSALLKAARLVPAVDAVAVLVGPVPGVVMQGQFVAHPGNAIAVIALHQMDGDGVGKGDITVVGVAEEIAAVHPPGEGHWAALGVAQTGSKAFVNDHSRIAGRGGIGVRPVMADKVGRAHAIPDAGVGAENQIEVALTIEGEG
ncbi:MAG: hypothetical protein BWY77_01779 [bacterium ADurb.Bin431]|nr:MAG: hypothetical protein BWY77_01779 [bacterium ADurb.Bin431]